MSPPCTPGEYKGSGIYLNKKRRRAYKSGDKIDPYVVFCFYDWTCHLCNEKIDPERVLPDLQAATLDHIKPLARGGRHSWDNVAPAHAACNFAKADLARLDKCGTMVSDPQEG